jgi:Ras-related protein Rab-22
MYEIEQAKVTMLGDANAGKSSLIQRFISNSYEDHSSPTIGATFLSKVIDFDRKSIKLSIWDTAGQERYNSLAASYSRDSRACILVYDITVRESFLGLKKWHKNIIDIINPDVVLAVVGNKEDLVDIEQTTLDEARTYADSIGALYMRTSAKLGSGVKELFIEISKKILGVKNLSVKDSLRSTAVALNPTYVKAIPKKKSCCN